MIYLDNASTTEVSKELKPLIDQYLYQSYGNAGSPHSFGHKAKMAIEKARTQIANAFNTSPDNIIFTSSGSEANTMAITGLAKHLYRYGLHHIVTTKYEHHSVLNAMKEMERLGFDVTYLDVPNGVVTYDNILSSFRNDTGLVSVMYVNNELGTKNNVERIYQLCRKREIIFHCDCVQAAGTEIIDMNLTADMISVSGHKIHAPKGVGCLCVKNKEYLSNIIFGGEQEYGLRPGTENVASIAALGHMIETTSKKRVENAEKIASLCEFFRTELIRQCIQNDIDLFFNTPSASKICSVRFDGVDAETLLLLLSDVGVCVSAGSACSSHSVHPSHVLKAIGLTDEQARSTIRVSFSDYNTKDEVLQATYLIADCISTLKSIQ